MEHIIKPPKNIQMFLFILHALGSVDGRIKLYKTHFLIESEGRVKYDMPIGNYLLGPVDYITIDFCSENGLIEEELHEGIPYDYYSISLSDEGKKYFEKECIQLISSEEKKKAIKVIDKYKSKSGTQILNYVHSKYVDKFKDDAVTKEIIAGFLSRVPVYQDLIQKNMAAGLSLEEEDSLYSVVGYLHHVSSILEKIGKIADPVKRGQVLLAIADLFEALKENRYKPDSYVKELFDYLDSYCEKEGICNSIASEDLSDIPKEVRERLLKRIALMEIP